MWRRLANNFEELRHKTEAVCCCVEERFQVKGGLDLGSPVVEILRSLGTANLDSPHSTISKLQSTHVQHHPQHRGRSTPPTRKEIHTPEGDVGRTTIRNRVPRYNEVIVPRSARIHQRTANAALSNPSQTLHTRVEGIVRNREHILLQ